MIVPLVNLTAWGYQSILKPVLFRFRADVVHESFSQMGELLGRTPTKNLMRAAWSYSDPRLEQNVAGIQFLNPVGLSAGFDYQAQLSKITPALGFGWHTIGTISIGAYSGNQPPMLARLPHSQSLWVNKGFKNPGAKAIIEKLGTNDFAIPTGISIGATNREYGSREEQIAEYCLAFQEFEDSGLRHQYYELNISCPNLKTGFGFYEPAALRQLLTAVQKLKLSRPVFVKMPIDQEMKDFLKLVEIIAEFKLSGLIVGNLTKDYGNPALFQVEAQKFTKGGFSGKPTVARSNEKIRAAYRLAGRELAIIGTGGIFTGADAYEKIKRGASLVQLITGMIYQGPQVIGQINRELVQIVKKDGFSHVSEAIGAEA